MSLQMWNLEELLRWFQDPILKFFTSIENFTREDGGLLCITARQTIFKGTWTSIIFNCPLAYLTSPKVTNLHYSGFFSFYEYLFPSLFSSLLICLFPPFWTKNYKFLIPLLTINIASSPYIWWFSIWQLSCHPCTIYPKDAYKVFPNENISLPKRSRASWQNK